jgi:phosphate transport system substrate-binding protein
VEYRTPSRSWGILRALALVWLGVLGGFAVGIEWIKSRPEAPRPSGGIDLVGAGATFPYPLYRRWFAEYGSESGVRINYFSVGSAEGIRLLLDGSADFGATDRPLTGAERARARCGPFELPTVVGAVAVAYRLPGLSAPLRLDAAVLADIFAGRVTAWDAPAIAALNPGIRLPSLAIHVVQRARITGTSALFARYLATSPRWAADSGNGRTLVATGSQVEGNEGVTAAISAQEGAIGVVEYTYAEQARLSVAALRNVSGAFVMPSPQSIASAADEMLTPASMDTSLGAVGAAGASAYPAVALTRIVADAALGDSVRGAHFVAFAQWALTDGAKVAADVGYASLPEAVIDRQRQRLRALRPGTCPTTPSP